MAKSAIAVQKRENFQSCGTVFLFDPFRVKPFEGQIRKRFRGIESLAASILEAGQATPIKVRLLDGDKDFDAELVDGERRLRACRHLKQGIQAVVDDSVGDGSDQFIHCVAANFGRQDHDPMEISDAIARLSKQGKTYVQIAQIFGKSDAWVSQYLSLQKLDPRVQKLLALSDEDVEGVSSGNSDTGEALRKRRKTPLPFSIALILVPLSRDHQYAAAQEIASNGMSMVAARRYVLKLLRVEGLQNRSHGHRRETWQALENIARRSRDTLGVYLDMPIKDLESLVLSATHANRGALLEEINNLASDLSQIAKAINRIGTRVP